MWECLLLTKVFGGFPQWIRCCRQGFDERRSAGERDARQCFVADRVYDLGPAPYFHANDLHSGRSLGSKSG